MNTWVLSDFTEDEVDVKGFDIDYHQFYEGKNGRYVIYDNTKHNTLKSVFWFVRNLDNLVKIIQISANHNFEELILYQTSAEMNKIYPNF